MVEVVSIAVGGMPLKILHLALRSLVAPFAWAREERLIHQAVILQKAHEHAAQQPRGPSLRQHALAPTPRRLLAARPASLAAAYSRCRAICVASTRRPLAQIVFEALQHTLEVIQQTSGVDQDNFPSEHSRMPIAVVFETGLALKQTYKASLLKMVVCCKCVHDIAIAHDDKARTVDKAPILIYSLCE